MTTYKTIKWFNYLNNGEAIGYLATLLKIHRHSFEASGQNTWTILGKGNFKRHNLESIIVDLISMDNQSYNGRQLRFIHVHPTQLLLHHCTDWTLTNFWITQRQLTICKIICRTNHAMKVLQILWESAFNLQPISTTLRGESGSQD